MSSRRRLKAYLLEKPILLSNPHLLVFLHGAAHATLCVKVIVLSASESALQRLGTVNVILELLELVVVCVELLSLKVIIHFPLECIQ